MKIVGLSGAIVGKKTRIAMDRIVKTLSEKYPEIDTTLIDLADYDVRFSDGRNYLDYEGDTRYVAKKVMEADAIIIGTPVFQASIPASLKNLFDLLPVNAFRNKVVGMIVTAGTPKHYLMAEQQLKPILAYMKAEIVQTYVFIEEKDFYQNKIHNDDIIDRIDRLVEDAVLLTKTYAKVHEEKEKEYGF
ncbi:NADPH-dependent FMN reductase [Sporolactobacillus vineae]|uniref:NADPH-dependent FMN reductase n=1 Tax=Sporolactobacillus vineae TaxID=444463 RepID=UPI000289E382|nr:NADPH-dependent FMN reductase [Sporolactobacillus vineae]